MTASRPHALLLLALAACFHTGSPAQAIQEPAATAAPAPPLESRAELDAWLAARAGRPTPLDALPPLARQRFLDSLVFGSGGVGGFSFSDLQLELTPSQVRAVLALFGREEHADAFETRLSEGETWSIPAKPSRIERAYDALYRQMQTKGIVWQDVETQYAAQFRPLFKEASLRQLTLRDLVHASLGAQLAARSSLEPDYSSDVYAAVQELERRGKAKTPDLRAAYDGLLIARRFDEARRFTDRNPDADLPVVPTMRDPLPPGTKAPTLWRFDPTGRSLVRTPIDLAPPQILIVAGCHFSQDAAEDIGKDPVLGPLFASHAQWLFLPPGGEDLDAARSWNRRFPQAPVGLLHTRAEWPLLPEQWVMPTFLFVRDGRVIETIKSWPRGPASQREPLIEAARRMGLLSRTP